MGRTIYEHSCTLASDASLDQGQAVKAPCYPMIELEPGLAGAEDTNEPSPAQQQTLWRALAATPHISTVLPQAWSWLLGRDLDQQQQLDLAATNLLAMAWHPYQEVLAASDGAHQVVIYSLAGLASASSIPGSLTEATATLAHAHQQQVTALAWRPRTQSTLAVSCRQGVCLWTVPFNSVKSSGTAGATMTMLQSDKLPVTCMAWHPEGQLLATGSLAGPGIVVWQVALGTHHRIQADLSPTAILTWSPDGCYLFAAPPASSSFRLWSTQQWISLPFTSPHRLLPGARKAAPGAGRVTAACWHSSGRLLMLGFAGTASLATLSFTEPAPSLDCQLLPLPLPGIAEAAGGVQTVAWDDSGERLAVGLSSGKLALLAAECSPLPSAKFIGWIEGTNGHASGAQPGQVAEFRSHCPSGALLAVRRGPKRINVLPLHFHSDDRSIGSHLTAYLGKHM